MSLPFSFIIITYNEEQHLPRLLKSIEELNAPLFVLDSGSTDATLAIADKAGAVTLHHPFENHPKQWNFALNNFDIKTPWVICLDADQIVTPELKEQLITFRNEDYQNIDSIYFNRKNFFKGRWIKHGGYYPIYLLKMFRYGKGHSDLNENMDHRFIISGKSIIWKNGHILEENLKENNISFWIDKHNRYSDLVAHEEVERMQNIRQQVTKPSLFGSPDQRTAWLKQIWWKLPRYVRPTIYFLFRVIFQRGILDGRTGVIFHFLQGFWFRLIVDIKIDEILNAQRKSKETDTKQPSPIVFAFKFVILFVIFYYFNILFFGITTPGGNHYSPFLANHFNYIEWLRYFLLTSSKQVLTWMGFTAINNQTDLLVAGRGGIRVIYSCLGLGLISFFSAFVLAYPRKLNKKITFLVGGILSIELLNILRFILLTLFWNKRAGRIIDHHTIFNITLYIMIMVSLYFWVKNDDKISNQHA
ncbi:exosortase/archaeosortase family protein [Mucilaginibacter pineti]|uniref:Exosortase/archaeosortase family protein n=1 Tax=Mucilaginibacter pineti TaxID=1391627 RepID=A0A1G6UN24_9SPHI|nr:glycosyltransferase [Mucilaginibacter pineti]SDD41925.1 exosortase/archaeosortase family protein [Mucilaginibacter pineti]